MGNWVTDKPNYIDVMTIVIDQPTYGVECLSITFDYDSPFSKEDRIFLFEKFKQYFSNNIDKANEFVNLVEPRPIERQTICGGRHHYSRDFTLAISKEDLPNFREKDDIHFEIRPSFNTDYTSFSQLLEQIDEVW